MKKSVKLYLLKFLSFVLSEIILFLEMYLAGF